MLSLESFESLLGSQAWKVVAVVVCVPNLITSLTIVEFCDLGDIAKV